MKHFKTLALAAALTLGSVQAQAAAFQNGDFAEGDSGWILSTGVDLWSEAGLPPFAGAVDLAAVFWSPSTLSQTFDTVATAGTTYSIKFYLSSDGSWGNNQLEADWNGTAVTLTAAANPLTLGTTSWTAYEATNLIGGTSSSTLSFVGTNVPGYIYLDNVSVTVQTAPVPEPATYAMLLAGLGMLGAVARRRARA